MLYLFDSFSVIFIFLVQQVLVIFNTFFFPASCFFNFIRSWKDIKEEKEKRKKEKFVWEKRKETGLIPFNA